MPHLCLISQKSYIFVECGNILHIIYASLIKIIRKTMKTLLIILLSCFSCLSLANNLGEDRAWDWPTDDSKLIKISKYQLGNVRLGDSRIGASGGFGGYGGPIGNNVIINYVINGDNNVISGNSISNNQHNSGDQQGIFNDGGNVNNDETNSGNISINQQP